MGEAHVWRSEVTCGSQFSAPPLWVQGIILRLSGLHDKPSCWPSIFIRWLVSVIRTILRVRSWRASCSFSQFYRITWISQTLNCLQITNRLKRLNKINIQMTINLDNVTLIWWATYRAEWRDCIRRNLTTCWCVPTGCILGFLFKGKRWCLSKETFPLESETNTLNLTAQVISTYLMTLNCEGRGLQKRHFSE